MSVCQPQPSANISVPTSMVAATCGISETVTDSLGPDRDQLFFIEQDAIDTAEARASVGTAAFPFRGGDALLNKVCHGQYGFSWS